MNTVMEWVKGVVILFVVLAALMYLLPSKKYKRYVQFFIEMVVIIAFVQPVARVIYAEEDFGDRVEYTQFWQEMENLQKDSKRLEFVQSDYYLQQYETAIAEDVTRMLETEEWTVKDTKVTLSAEYELQEVSLFVALKESAGEDGEISAGKELARRAQQETAEMEIKEELKAFYHLEDADIRLTFE